MAAPYPESAQRSIPEIGPDVYPTNTPLIDLAIQHGEKFKEEMEQYRTAYLLLYH